MDYIEAIQNVVWTKRKEKGSCTYLEIGVDKGGCFFHINASRKIAVDPHMIPEIKEFHRCESDYYFSHNDIPIDVVFVDGLHQQEQVLRDVKNSLEVLMPGGIICIHDCLPPFEAAAHPVIDSSIPGWTGAWCGTVWKAVAEINQTWADVDIFTIDILYGLGIVTKLDKKRKLPEKLDFGKMKFKDFQKNQKELLNIKSVSFFKSWLKGREM